MSYFEEETRIFGNRIPHEEYVPIVNNLKKIYRRPFVKKDMSTHGDIWQNLRVPFRWAEMDKLNMDEEGEILVFFDAGKSSRLYESSFSCLSEYLKSRDLDDIYPPLYAFNRSMSFLYCDIGEYPGARPIRLMVAFKEGK
ncbi:hypothetical protein [Microbulbifer sp. ZKSA002]|uniref:hypothetical protein n=1 Tax=Microbulbifer sp. ZKSA002 TaxID=3243388 RepID=UPI0040393E60